MDDRDDKKWLLLTRFWLKMVVSAVGWERGMILVLGGHGSTPLPRGSRVWHVVDLAAAARGKIDLILAL